MTIKFRMWCLRSGSRPFCWNKKQPVCNYLSSESAQLVKKAENKPYQLPKAKAEVYLTIFPGLVQRKPHYRTHTLFRMISQQFFGCVEWKSVHGPGDVHHEYVFPRWDLRRLNPLRWFNHQQKKIPALRLEGWNTECLWPQIRGRS